jgi:hypothetical protein
VPAAGISAATNDVVSARLVESLSLTAWVKYYIIFAIAPVCSRGNAEHIKLVTGFFDLRCK